MAIIYVCSADHYGESSSTPWVTSTSETSPGGWSMDNPAMVGDGWASEPRISCILSPLNLNGRVQLRPSGTYKIGKPEWGARSGDYSLLADKVSQIAVRISVSDSNTYSFTRDPDACYPLTIPGDSNNVRLIHFAFSISELPVTDMVHGVIVDFRDSAGLVRASLGVNPTGRLQLTDGTLTVFNQFEIISTPTSLVLSSAPVIQPETWYSLSIKITTSSNPSITTADVDVYLGPITDDTRVISGTGLSFSGTGHNTIDMLGFLPATPVPHTNGPHDNVIRAVRDIVICDTTGDLNNDLLGQVFVSAQEVRTEATGGGWVAQHRANLGDGVLDHTTNLTGLRFADSDSLEIGASDFTFETFIRFATLPDDPNLMRILTKWRAAAGMRSYQLSYDGTDNTLVWEVSTDGTDSIEVKRVPWVPLTAHWYHLAVSRASGQTMFFIDGVQLGVPIADANTYYDGTAYLGVGVQFTDVGAPDTSNRFDGWMDETRFTIGSARYTSDFTPPTAKFGRDISADPLFNDVVLLMGYDDEAITDESSFARTITVGSPAVTSIFPADGDASFEVLNQRPAWDDTFIEAPYLYAQGIFTFEDVPTVSETMTVGDKTYTWVETLSTVGPNEVLIGSDIGECIANIIAAINAADGEGTVYGSGTTENEDAQAEEFLAPQFILTAKAIGTDGNSVATTDTMTDGFFGAATLEGGQDIPADSSFTIERLPADATGVLGVQITSRAYKTDAGTAKVRLDLVGPGGAVAAGSEQTPDLNPAWMRQIFETDPDTSASMTPSTLNGGKLKFKRTT